MQICGLASLRSVVEICVLSICGMNFVLKLRPNISGHGLIYLDGRVQILVNALIDFLGKILATGKALVGVANESPWCLSG